MKKRIISFLTSAAIALTCLSGGLSEITSRISITNETTIAKAATYSEKISYGDYLTIQKVDEDEDGAYEYIEIDECVYSAGTVEIPSEIDGLPVTSIGNAAFYFCPGLTSITIPDSVSSIGDEAFLLCTNLTSITIPDSVTDIGEDAFSECYNLTNVYITDLTAWCNIKFNNYESNPLYYADILYLNNEPITDLYIPDGVTKIPCYGFSSENIVSITIPASVTSIEEYAFRKCKYLEKIYITDIASWCNIDFKAYDMNPLTNLYFKNELITNLVIPDGVTSIREAAFSCCSSLESITIPDSVTNIGNAAFNNCSSLESITIPDSVTSIGDYAFSNCDSLTSITIPDSVTSIGDGAFEYCDSLTNITIPDSVTNIGKDAFSGCTGLESITIPDSVTNIGDGAFEYCDSLTNITIPDSVTNIGDYTFSFCDSLTNITIPDSVTSIGDGAFEYCDSLTNITIPDSVTSIGKYAFSGCTGLESITIPESVKVIGSNAFHGCNKIKEIIIPATVETIEEKAFGYSSSDEKIANFKIYGTIKTSAEIYALINGITFIDINNTPFMNRTELSLNVGDNYMLEVKNFDGEIVWGSNDTAIATVKDGYISAVSEGETVVYAILSDTVLECTVVISGNGNVTTPIVTTAPPETTTTTTTTETEVVTTKPSNTTTNSAVTTISDVPIVTTDISTTTAPVTTTEIITTTVDTNIFDIKEVDGGIIIIDCDTLVVNITVPVEINGVEIIKINDYVFSSSDLKTITFDNPNVIITDSATTINEDAVIYGYWESTAHDYATKYKREFVSLDGEPDYVQGDITGDGNINLYDAIDICKYIMGMKKLTEDEETIADFDENGVVDLYDAIGIAKKLLE